jgi:hypothetical protein
VSVLFEYFQSPTATPLRPFLQQLSAKSPQAVHHATMQRTAAAIPHTHKQQKSEPAKDSLFCVYY